MTKYNNNMKWKEGNSAWNVVILAVVILAVIAFAYWWWQGADVYDKEEQGETLSLDQIVAPKDDSASAIASELDAVSIDDFEADFGEIDAALQGL